MKIFGHRGAPGFPRRGENTIGSFRRALDAGADGFELDVRRCADGQLVVIHDATVDRTTNGSGAVHALTYAELSRFDAGGGDSIPLLAAVFDEFAGRGAIHIELKEAGLTHDVVDLLLNSRLENAAAISAFDADDGHGGPGWEELRAASANVPTALLTTPDKLERVGIDPYIRIAQDLRASALHVAKEAVDGYLIDRAHEAGLALRVFTVNSVDQAARFHSLGADGIFTDFPDRMTQLGAVQ